MKGIYLEALFPVKPAQPQRCLLLPDSAFQHRAGVLPGDCSWSVQTRNPGVPGAWREMKRVFCSHASALFGACRAMGMEGNG